MSDQPHELPFLAGIAGIIRWFEELVNLLSGPLLTFGLAISLIDLLTDGALLTHEPALLYAWAISQAVGVDGQLVGAWDKARIAIREHRWLPLIGLVFLGTALGYVAWVSAQVFGIQQAEGITVAQALFQLGMDKSAWLIQRSLLSVVLVALSGFNRYHPPTKVESSTEDETARLERELVLEPLRQKVRTQKAQGAVSLVRGLVKSDTGSNEQSSTELNKASAQTGNGAARHVSTAKSETGGTESDPFPTGPGSPVASHPKPDKRVRSHSPSLIKLAKSDKPRRKVARLGAEARVRRILMRHPDATLDDICRRAHVSKTTARKYKTLIEGEVRQIGEIGEKVL